MIFLTLVFVYVITCIWSPFIHWQTFFSIFYNVIRYKELPLQAKYRAISFLLKELAITPVFTVLWYIDEIFYHKYSKQQIKSPIFIISQPRSGTTFLHKTLSQDTRFLSIKHMEYRYPFICFWKIAHLLNVTKYIENINYWPRTPYGMKARKLHAHKLGSYEEHGMYFEERVFHHYFLYRRFPIPDFLDEMSRFSKLTAKQQEKVTNVFHKVLQKISFLHPQKEIYLTKENESIELYTILSDKYPDAKYIVLTRETDDFLNSFVHLSTLSTLVKTEVDPMSIPNWHESNLKFRREECLRMIDFINQTKIRSTLAFISYHDLVHNVEESILLLYNDLGLTMDRDYRKKLSEIKSNQKNRVSGYKNNDISFHDFDFYTDFINSINQ